MAQPTAYNRVTSFANYQAVNPTTPLPASSVDQEFNAIKTTLDQILENLELIQRDDGDLANESVGFDQLADEVSTGMFNRPTVWVTGTAYEADDDAVFTNNKFYRCLVSHTSGVFATDLAAAKWELIVDLTSIPVQTAAQVSVTPTGGIAATDVQAALAELDSEKAATSHSHAASAISDSTAAGRALLTAANVAAQLSALGLTYGAPNYGEIRHTAAISAPSGWLFCYGQAISRTTYASLFAAISISQTGTRTNASAIITDLSDTSNMRAGMPVSGTGIPSSTTILSVDSGTQITLSQNATSSGSNTVVVAPHGVGDGSTTFNVPDIRGRALAGRDDMGGTSANRLTDQSGGVNGDRLGDDGGAETHALTEAQLASHTHTASVTDPGHTHTGTAPVDGDTAATSVGGGPWVTDGGTTTLTINSNTTGITVSNATAGSGAAHNNVQPTIIENAIIFAGV